MQVHSRMAFLLASVVVACGDGAEADLSHLTSRVRASVEPNGRFVLAAQASGELSASQAIGLAVAYAHTAGVGLSGAWAQDRGEPVDAETLTSCGRAYYARSPFEQVDKEASAPLRRFVSPKWLTTLCDESGHAVVSIAVPAVDTGLRVTRGVIENVADADFTSVGIPADIGAAPPDPEIAAREVAERTGRLVASVPELVLPPPPAAPQMAKWRILLHAPVAGKRADGEQVTAREVYFGFLNTWRTVALSVADRQNNVREVDDIARRARVALRIADGYGDSYVSFNPEP